ncbi:MAG: alcohol dehydrogenase catalytic domain-containing protein [Candidatus Eisenbacteria bacterium]
MRALIYHAPHDIRLGEAPEPRLLDDRDAIVRVEAAGLCGSDLHVWHGRETGLDPGTVMGHEFAGSVVEAGPQADWRVGDRVVAPFTTNCGNCFYCHEGLTARCTSGQLFGWVQGGAGLQGGQAELVRVPLADSTLIPVPEGVPLEVALLMGDALATGWHAARKSYVRHGQVVAVLGLGPVGLCAVLAAQERGVGRVFALDGVAERRAFATSLGAEAHDAGAGALAAVRAVTEGRGADVVLECAGSPAAARLAFDLVRPGGTISAVGVHHEAGFAFSPIEAYDRNLTYRIGRCPARAYAEDLVPVVRHHAATLSRMITHRVPIERGPEMYRLFDEKREGCLKVVFALE